MKGVISILKQIHQRQGKDPFDSLFVDLDDEEVTFEIDPLANSCASFRLGRERNFFNLSSEQAKEFITGEDFARAHVIRKYYGKKFLWNSLTEKPLSEFRKNLLAYIHSENPNRIKRKMEGMIYRLPEFYAEDLAMDEIKKSAETSWSEDRRPPSKITKTLKPLTVIKTKNRTETVNRYWFLDDLQRLCNVKIHQPNPLEPFWVDIFNSSVTINISGNYIPRKRDDYNFYEINNWNLEK